MFIFFIFTQFIKNNEICMKCQEKMTKESEQTIENHIETVIYHFKRAHKYICNDICYDSNRECMAKNKIHHNEFQMIKNLHYDELKAKISIIEKNLKTYWRPYNDIFRFLDNPKGDWMPNEKRNKHHFLIGKNYEVLFGHEFEDFDIYKNTSGNKIIAIHKRSTIKMNLIFGNKCIILEYCDIDENVSLGSGVLIGKNSIIGSLSSLGDNCILLNNVRIYVLIKIDAFNIVMDNVKFGNTISMFEEKHLEYHYFHQNILPICEKDATKFIFYDIYKILKRYKRKIYIGKGNIFSAFTAIKDYCIFMDYNFFGYYSRFSYLTFCFSINIFIHNNSIRGRCLLYSNLIFGEYQMLLEFSRVDESSILYKEKLYEYDVQSLSSSSYIVWNVADFENITKAMIEKHNILYCLIDFLFLVRVYEYLPIRMSSLNKN